MTLIPIAKIRTDGGTQPRAAIDFEAVDDYTDAMLAGTKFPPVIVFYDGSDYWLADGFHRRNAAFSAELKEIECDVRQGTREDAQWFSFSANKANGLRRTNEDKQRAVKAALLHPKCKGLSDHAIAKHVGVTHPTVISWRAKLESTGKIFQSDKRTGRDGRTINTANIGRKPEPKPEPKAPAPSAPPPAPPEQTTRRADPVGVHIVPPPASPLPPKADPAIAAKLLRAITDLAAHEISAVELMKQLAGISDVAAKAHEALEFIKSVCEIASKREKGVA